MAKRLSKSADAADFTENTTESSGNTAIQTIPNGIDGALNPPVDAKTDPYSLTSVALADKRSVAKHLKSLDGAFDAVRKAFFTIGFGLYWFDDTGAYQQIEGREYGSISDFAKDRYGLGRTTTYNYLSVVKRFGKTNPETGEVDALQDKYKDFSSTALIIMSGMTDEQLTRCTPGMKVKQLKAVLANADLLEDSDGSGGNGTGKNEGLREFKPEKKSSSYELYTVSSVDDLEENKKEIFNIIKKMLSQDSGGIQYRVSIVASWQYLKEWEGG